MELNLKIKLKKVRNGIKYLIFDTRIINKYIVIKIEK